MTGPNQPDEHSDAPLLPTGTDDLEEITESEAVPPPLPLVRGDGTDLGGSAVRPRVMITPSGTKIELRGDGTGDQWVADADADDPTVIRGLRAQAAALAAGSAVSDSGTAAGHAAPPRAATGRPGEPTVQLSLTDVELLRPEPKPRLLAPDDTTSHVDTLRDISGDVSADDSSSPPSLFGAAAGVSFPGPRPAQIRTAGRSEPTERERGGADQVDATVTLSVDDLEIVTGDALPKIAPVSGAALAVEWGADQKFYEREALAWTERSPGRSAWMWLEAARAAEADGATTQAQELVSRAVSATPRPPLALLCAARHVLNRVGGQVEALALAEKVADLGESDAVRAAMLTDSALSLYRAGQDLPRARALLSRAGELCAEHPLELTLRLSLEFATRDFAAAAHTLEQMVTRLEAPEERGAALVEAGLLHEAVLASDEGAERLYQLATDTDPDALLAHTSLGMANLRSGNLIGYARSLELTAYLPVGTSVALRSLTRAASAHLYHGRNLDRAVELLQRAVELAPRAVAPIARLAITFEAEEQIALVERTLRQWIDVTLDADEKCALYCRLAFWLRGDKHRRNDVTECYWQALARSPNHAGALLSLEVWLRRHQDHPRLLQFLLSQSEQPQAVALRAARFLELGDILDENQGRSADGAEAYQRALELDKSNRLASLKLSRLLAREGRFVELGRLLAWRASTTSDARVRNALYLELGDVQLVHLKTPSRAIESLDAARADETNGVAQLRAIEVCRQTGHHQELVQVLLDEASRTSDPQEALWRKIDAAMVLEQRLAEEERALGVYQEILARDSACEPAFLFATRLCQSRGLWGELEQLLRNRLAHTDVTQRQERLALRLQLASLLEEEQGQADEALVVLTEALAAAPDSPVPLSGIERLAARGQKHKLLQKTLASCARLRKDPLVAADLLCRAAEIAEFALGDLDEAADLHRAALDLAPRTMESLEGLLALALRAKNDEALAEHLDRAIPVIEDPVELALCALKRGMLAERQGDHEQALMCYRDAAEHPLLTRPLALLRLWLHQRQADLALYEHPETHTLIDKLADPTVAAAFLLLQAHVHEHNGRAREQGAVADRGLARGGPSLLLLWARERALHGTRSFAELLQAKLIEAEVLADPSVRVQCLAEACDAALLADDVRGVQQVAARVLSLVPAHLPMMRRLLWAADQLGDGTLAPRLLEQIAGTSADAQNRRQASLQATGLWRERVRDPKRALSCIERALRNDPDDAVIFDRARALLEDASAFEQLSELYAVHISATHDRERRLELLYQHAELLQRELGQVDQAISRCRELCELSRDNLQALRLLAELSVRAGRWTDADDALTRLAALLSDADERRQVLLTRASVLLNELHVPDRALELCEQLLAQDSRGAAAKRLRAESLIALGHYDEAQTQLDELTADEASATQVWALSMLAEVAHRGRRDEALRDQYDVEALRIAGTGQVELTDLLARYRKASALPRFARLVKQVVEEHPHETELGSVLLATVVPVLLEDLHRPDEALAILEQPPLATLTTIYPDDDPRHAARLALLRAQALEGQQSLETAFAAYCELIINAPQTPPALHGVARLSRLLGRPALADAAFAAASYLETARNKPRGWQPPPSAGDDSMTTRTSVVGVLTLGAPSSLEPRVRRVVEILQLVAPDLRSLYPPDPKHVTETPAHPAVVAAHRVARQIGLDGVTVTIRPCAEAEAGVGNPAPLTLSPALAARPGSAAFVFFVARALTDAVSGGALLARLSDAELMELMEALTVEKPIGPSVQRLRKQLLRVLPRRVRKLLTQFPEVQLAHAELAELRNFIKRRGNHVGLVLTGNAAQALCALANADAPADPTTRDMDDLIRFLLTDEFETLTRALKSAT